MTRPDEQSSTTTAGTHITPLWLLLSVWGALMVLTLLTVVAARIDLGSLNLWVAMGIATLKAILVLLFFMHLLHGRPFHRFIIFTALVFAFLFIGITLMDTIAYQPDRIPGYAPLLNR
jgi:cytochrome c oxidase subunit IV